MKQAWVEAHKVEIYIAGDLSDIELACAEYCARGMCVTVTPTNYIYTGGSEHGAIIGLINYARFPVDADTLWGRAKELADMILERAGQQSYTIQSATDSVLYSNRPDHNL